MTQDADVFTDVDRSLWFDRIEELCERYAATRLRRVSGKKGERSNSEGERCNSEGKRSNSQGERSNSEGERSNSEGDGGKTFRADAA